MKDFMYEKNLKNYKKSDLKELIKLAKHLKIMVDTLGIIYEISGRHVGDSDRNNE